LVFRTFEPPNFTFTKTSKNLLCSSIKYLQVLREKFRASSFPEIRWWVWKTWFFAILMILALFRVYTFLVLHSGLACESKHFRGKLYAHLLSKKFFLKVYFFENRSVKSDFFPFWELKYQKLPRVRSCSFTQECCTWLKLSEVVTVYVGKVSCKRSFWCTVLYRPIKNKMLIFREFVPIMRFSEQKIWFFIFRALMIYGIGPSLPLECFPLIGGRFMFLEFWLKLFIKIPPGENMIFT